MQVLEFFKGKKNQQPETIQFTPTISINPNSTLFVQCTPDDPHTASNIVINSYPSKTNRINLQTRIQWKRFKIASDSQHTNTHLPFNTGNAYRCEPADLGYYIQAKIISYDVACSGSAEVTVGPIRLDPTVKQLIQGALYSRSLRSQVKVQQKNQQRDIDMLLSDKTIRFIDNLTNKQLQMSYDMQQPKIEVNPKDPTKIFLRFERDETNKVKQWLDCLFQTDPNFDVQSKKSFNSQGSGSSKSRVFKTAGSLNKIQIIFLTRHSRDQFIFSLRAFVCKQSIKNTIAIETIQNVTQMRTPADAFKFFQYMSLKNQIYRLSQLAKNLQTDRDNKLKDLISLQQSIAETTTTYVQLLQKKGRQFNLDFNQSYSQISIRRDEIMGKKQLRQLQTQNTQLKQTIRQLNVQLQLKQFFAKKNNESVMLNQTSNPFAKKNSDSYYGPSMAYQQDQNIQKQNMNFAQLSRSHANLIKQNQKLKQEKKMYIISANNNQSISKDLDMVNLLESLHQADQQPAVVIQKLRAQNKLLKDKNQQMLQQMKKVNKTQIGKLNQSIAYQQQNKKQNSVINPSFIDSKQGSFLSNLNDSMTSEAALMALENKVKQIATKNKQILSENQRLRSERDKYRLELEKVKKNLSVTSPIQHRSVLSTSNFFDPENLRQQNQTLLNERNSLRQKVQSLIKQNSKGGDSLYEKKCEQLTKQNNYLRKQNEGLRQKLQSMKNQSKVYDSFATQNYKQNDKLKKINSQLLEEIKNLKLQLQKKANPLYNSRVIQLENEVNFLKNTGENREGVQKATQQLLNQISKLQKQVQHLVRQNNDKQAKLISQTSVIERLMNSQQQNANSVSGKDKSYSQTRNQSESTQKLRKKIKQLQQEIVMMRRSADALNRSQDMSRDMLSYNQQQMQMYRKEKQIMLIENQKLSKMCERYCKDARQANKQLAKWKQQVFDMMKNQKHQQI